MISFDYSTTTPTLSVYCSVANALNGSTNNMFSTQGRLDYVVNMPTGATNIDIRFTSFGAGSNVSFSIDNVLIKKLAEPITNTISTVVNEDFSTASNWVGTNTTINYSAGALRIAGSTAGNTNAKKTVNLIQDQLYRVTFSSSALSMGTANIAFAVDNNDGTEQSVEQFATVNKTTASSYTFYIIPRTNNNSLLFNITGITGAFTFDIDNFKIENVVNPANPMYSAVLNNLEDFYSYHSSMPGRAYNNNIYRYGGSNGQERDRELGAGVYTAEFWEYNSNLGPNGRWNRDPVTNPSMSDYACFNDNPILNTDVNGDTPSESTGGDGDDDKCITCPKKGVPSVDKNKNSQQDNLKKQVINPVDVTAEKTLPPTGGWGTDQGTIKPDNRTDAQKAESAHKAQYGGGDGKGGAVDMYAEAKYYLFKGVEKYNELPATIQIPLMMVGIGEVAGVTQTVRGATFGESLFLSGRFGITSEKFGSSLVKSQGSFNQPGGILKMGWSNVSKNGGGMQMRIGIGSKVTNSNQALIHFYVPKTFVPNSFANPSMQVKLSLYKLGL